jgi:hypothetical protein
LLGLEREATRAGECPEDCVVRGKQKVDHRRRVPGGVLRRGPRGLRHAVGPAASTWREPTRWRPRMRRSMVERRRKTTAPEVFPDDRPARPLRRLTRRESLFERHQPVRLHPSGIQPESSKIIQ